MTCRLRKVGPGKVYLLGVRRAGFECWCIKDGCDTVDEIENLGSLSMVVGVHCEGGVLHKCYQSCEGELAVHHPWVSNKTLVGKQFIYVVMM